MRQSPLNNKQIIGLRFGSLTVLEHPANARSKIACRCDCGRIQTTCYFNLAHGRSKRCKSCMGKCNRRPKYGASIRGSNFERLYWIWMRMRDRCTSPNRQNSHLYSLRGIKVCPEWQNDFAAFRDWSLANGYRDDLTIDRWPDQNGNYEPANCRWATQSQQMRNTRKNRLVTAFGETKTLIEWSEDSRCIASYSALKSRLAKGWPAEHAISTPYSVAARSRALKTSGNLNTNSKLTADKVRSIRWLCASGASQGTIAKQFGVSQASVSAIHRRSHWKWLPD